MSAIDSLPPLREVLARHGIRARKSLGQNFILDFNVLCRIAQEAGVLKGRAVVEIGAGPGGLTRALLASGAGRVIAVERDRRFLPALAEIRERFPERLAIVAGDARRVDCAALGAERPKIVANLPYNVATALLTGWLGGEIWPPPWESLTLMFQREVAERIVAKPGSRAWSRLSVLAQWRAKAERRMRLPARIFTPAPEVDSALVHLTPSDAPGGVRFASLQAVSAAAFGQRRKMLKRSLQGAFARAEAACMQANINPELRADRLALEGFIALARLHSREGK